MGDNFQEKPNPVDVMMARAQELQREGYDWHQAISKADLEHWVREWPSPWGDSLHILIFGDFDPPETDLYFSQSGITIYAERLENSRIRSVKCVLKATVRVEEKTVAALLDAMRRINILLGAWTLVTWGNNVVGWHPIKLIEPLRGHVQATFSTDSLAPIIGSVASLPQPVQRKVDAALYWVRVAHYPAVDFEAEDSLMVYTAYWNAFECLVEAINVLKPQNKLSKSEKQQRIDSFVSQRAGRLTSSDIEQCYQEIVNPGFVGKASHALRVCFGSDADKYIRECFRLADRRNRLYDIRNAINHGEIDAEHPEERFRIESRLRRLWMIIWRMFGYIVPFSAPVDSKLASHEPK